MRIIMVYKPTYNWGAPSCINTGYQSLVNRGAPKLSYARASRTGNDFEAKGQVQQLVCPVQTWSDSNPIQHPQRYNHRKMVAW